VNGTGFPLAYLFLENNGNCSGLIRTDTIAQFLIEIRLHKHIEPKFFLTDKDFAQISAAPCAWPSVKIQLCRWHMQHAIETKLKDSKKAQQIIYDPFAAREKFSFIKTTFAPTIETRSEKICPKEPCKNVWEIINRHLHQHPLIPNSTGEYLTSIQIREQAVKEIYSFYKQHSLIRLWVYLWKEWYNDSRWELWARSTHENISILKTTMFIEGHWKALKRDFLYKFFRPHLDLVTYIILLKMIPLQKRKFQQILDGRESPEWKKQFKAEWKQLSKRSIENTYATNLQNWVCSCPYFLINRFMICKHLVQLKGVVNAEFFRKIQQNPFICEGICEIPSSMVRTIATSETENAALTEEGWEDSVNIYDRLIDVTEKALGYLKEHKETKNSRWIKGVERNFLLIENMVREVETYRHRRTMPLTWKDHSNNTRFLN
jgi:hypothetical protein